MKQFLKRHASHITGTLSGFDRLLFRGTLRSICYQKGMDILLSSEHVLYKDFGSFAQKISDRLKTHAEAMAEQLKRPLVYITSAKESKEAIARAILEKDGIAEGLICILSCVEPCQSFSTQRDQGTGHLVVIPALRKCLHVYFYYMDREFGLMHLRLQTWLPMSIEICINGREWLGRELDRAHIGYKRSDNCFPQIDDVARAQQLLERLSHRKWYRMLSAMARRVNPWLAGNQLHLRGYYWTVRQAEFATDVMFRDAESLHEYYPLFVRHAIDQFGSGDVLRFLGRRTNIRFQGEVHSDLKRRIEGVRVKHWVESNSIKMYDKQGSVLRIETTINNPHQFKVRRHMKCHGNPVTAWVRMRKGVVDMRRLVQVCQRANERYLEALAVIGEPSPSHKLLDSVSVPVTRNGRRFRALRPISPEDSAIFQRVAGPAALLQGFRNKDIRPLLTAEQEQNPTERRKCTAHTSRTLRLLCAHELIYKVPTTNYYRIAKRGHEIISTSLLFRESNIALLAA